jgi:hypothetical protein
VLFQRETQIGPFALGDDKAAMHSHAGSIRVCVAPRPSESCRPASLEGLPDLQVVFVVVTGQMFASVVLLEDGVEVG